MCGKKHGGSDENILRGGILKDLDEERSKSILNTKRIELALTRYMDREEKIRENMNKIYGIVFGKCTPSLQSVMKGFLDYENESKYYDCLWIMEELKKIKAGVEIKANPSMSIIK